jgi:hypothetical protein
LLLSNQLVLAYFIFVQVSISIKKINPFKQFNTFKKFKASTVNQSLVSKNDWNRLNRLNDLSDTTVFGKEDGAGDRGRTGDVQLGKLAFYR